MSGSVNKKGSTPEFGVLLYDVPKGNISLYQKIVKLIRSRATRINKSVWLCPWGQKEAIERLLDSEQASGGVSYGFIATHDQDKELLAERAKQSLAREIDNIHKRIKEKIDKLEKEGQAPHLTAGQARGLRRQFKDMESALAVFKLTQDFESSLTKLQEVVTSQLHQAGVSETGGRKKLVF